MTRFALIAVVLAGCTTVRSQADTEFAHGNYQQAVALYNRVLATTPNDAAARSRRTIARTGVLRAMLVSAEAERHAGHGEVAAMRLADTLDQRDTWGIPTPPAIAPQLADEVAAIGGDLTSAVTTRTHDVGPLAGEAVVHRYDRLLQKSDFGTRRDALLATTRDAGQASCAALAPSATTPYATWVIDRYCTHFGGPHLAVPAPLPNLVGDVAIDGAVSGAPAGDADVLRGEVASAMRASVWFAPAAQATHATMAGTLAAAFDAHPRTISRGWTETVSYTDYETSQESYDEPYTETETTTTQEMQPDGSFQTVSHSELVTKTRTAWRTVQKPVQKTREEPRVFTFQAIQKTGRYASELSVRVDHPAVTAAIARQWTDQGLEHDTTFTPARVAPEHVQLMTLQGFAAREADALHLELVRRLDASYAATYCEAPRYTLEAAAACAYLDAGKAPVAVHAALAETFGADEAFLAPVLAR